MLTTEEQKNFKSVSYITADNNERYINIMDILHKSYQPSLDMDEIMKEYNEKYINSDIEINESNLKSALDQLHNWNCIETDIIKDNENARTIEEFNNAKIYYRISPSGKVAHDLCIVLKGLKDKDPNSAGLNIETFREFDKYVCNIPNKKETKKKLENWDSLVNKYKLLDENTTNYIRYITKPQFLTENFDDAFEFHQIKIKLHTYLESFINDLIKQYSSFNEHIQTYITPEYLQEIIKLKIDDTQSKFATNLTEEDIKDIEIDVKTEFKRMQSWFGFKYMDSNNRNNRYYQLIESTKTIIQKIITQNNKYLNDNEGFNYSKESIFLKLVEWTEKFENKDEIANMHSYLFGIEKVKHFVVKNELNNNYYNDLKDLKPSIIEINLNKQNERKKVKRKSILALNQTDNKKDLEIEEQKEEKQINDILNIFDSKAEITLDHDQEIAYEKASKLIEWFLSSTQTPNNEKTIYYSGLYENTNELKIEIITNYSEYITITTELNQFILPKIKFILMKEG